MSGRGRGRRRTIVASIEEKYQTSDEPNQRTVSSRGRSTRSRARGRHCPDDRAQSTFASYHSKDSPVQLVPYTGSKNDENERNYDTGAHNRKTREESPVSQNNQHMQRHSSNRESDDSDDNFKINGERSGNANNWGKFPSGHKEKSHSYSFGESRNNHRSAPQVMRSNGYTGHNPDLEELYSQINISGVNLEKQDAVEVSINDFKRKEVTAASCRRDTFEEMGLDKELMNNIKRLKWSKPTPVQKHAISILSEGRDLMACAQTGSGKTGAMLIPVINYLINQGSVNPPSGHMQKPKCLILAPTRELASQIYDDAARLCGRNTGVRPALCYGGASYREQEIRVRKGTSIMIGTPGRVKDFVHRLSIYMDEIEFFILDEADEMLKQGFRHDIQELHANINPDVKMRTMACFSATFETDIQRFGATMLHAYIFLSIGVVGAANADIKQEFYYVERKEKMKKCGEIVNKIGMKQKVLIFVATKVFADTLGTLLNNEPYNIRSTTLHGDRQQEDRDRAIHDFKVGNHRVLVATDVGSRGLDVKDIGVVINFDMPNRINQYVHRIGRTARIGHTGRSVSFLERGKDEKMVPFLISSLADCKHKIPEVLKILDTSGGSDCIGMRHEEDIRKYNSILRERGQDYDTENFMPNREYKNDEPW